MVSRGVRLMALLVLYLYLGAAAHELIPVVHDHGQESCSFCFLLTASIVAISAVVLVVNRALLFAAPCVQLRLAPCAIVCDVLLRGPPSHLL